MIFIRISNKISFNIQVIELLCRKNLENKNLCKSVLCLVKDKKNQRDFRSDVTFFRTPNLAHDYCLVIVPIENAIPCDKNKEALLVHLKCN